jgi:hypothetical protein
MLATLNSKQIVDEIVKDTMKDNDPHDVLQISPDLVRASRTGVDAPTLAPEIGSRSEPRISVITETPAAAPSVDTAIRVDAGDLRARPKRSAIRRWLSGAFATFLFAGAGVAATVVWERHGDTAMQMIANWVPALTSSLAPSSAQTPPAAADQAAQLGPQPPAEQASADQPATPPAAQDNAAAAAAPPEPTQALQTMTHDLAAMSEQIEQLKTSIAALKAGQEQMAREMAKMPAARSAEARPVEPHARVSALPPRPPAAPVRKLKPVTASAYTPAYASQPIAPPPQVAAVPPPVAPAPPPQPVADDDGPVVRPPMPVH